MRENNNNQKLNNSHFEGKLVDLHDQILNEHVGSELKLSYVIIYYSVATTESSILHLLFFQFVNLEYPILQSIRYTLHTHIHSFI